MVSKCILDGAIETEMSAGRIRDWLGEVTHIQSWHCPEQEAGVGFIFSSFNDLFIQVFMFLVFNKFLLAHSSIEQEEFGLFK